MKWSDDVKLAYREFAYGKRECVISMIIHSLLIVGVLFSVTLFLHVSGVGESFFGNSSDGYWFRLSGFTEEDTEWLHEHGITMDIVDVDGNPKSGKAESLRGIWVTKFAAVIQGKDIWNELYDDALTVLLFLHILFLVTAFVLWIVWINTMLNSWAMKTAERKLCIDMYHRLGMPRTDIAGLYLLYFLIRDLIALGAAIGVNALLIGWVNRYLRNSIEVDYRMPAVSAEMIAITAVMMFLFLLIGCRKMRRNQRVFEG